METQSQATALFEEIGQELNIQTQVKNPVELHDSGSEHVQKTGWLKNDERLQKVGANRGIPAGRRHENLRSLFEVGPLVPVERQ